MKIMKIKSYIDFKLVLKFSPILGVLLCIALWQVAIKKTWDRYSTYYRLAKVDNQTDQLSISPAFTRDRAIAAGKLFNKFEVDTVKWKSKLWNHCATLSSKHNVSMRSFPLTEQIASGKGYLIIQKIEMAGNYHDLLRLQQELEGLAEVGKITGLVYQKPVRDSSVTLTIILTGIPLKSINKL
jgi:hypothetical protein